MLVMIEDEVEILRLAKVVSPSSNDISSIYELYKKYVQADAQPPQISRCSSCGNSVVKMWRELITWYNKNK